MTRLNFIAAILVTVICCQSSYARCKLRHRASCRPSCCKRVVCRPTQIVFPVHCLQQKWLDYSGTDDLYICTTEYGPDCFDDQEDQLWYGDPGANPPVQHCEDDECESDTNWDNHIEGHGMVLTESNAWDFMRERLEDADIPTGSMERKFYKLEEDKDLGIDDDIYFIAVPITIPRGPMRGRTRYLGLETNEVTNFVPVKPEFVRIGPGDQLKVRVSADADRWTGHIWRK